MGKTGRASDSAVSIGLNVTLPCEARYLPLVRRLAERAADHLGYRAPHRGDVVCAIEQAVLRVFEPGDAASYTHVELCMAAGGRSMRVRIRYLGAPLPRDGVPIERLLSRPGPDGVPIERLRRSMGTVVLGRGPDDEGADFCELTRALPDVS